MVNDTKFNFPFQLSRRPLAQRRRATQLSHFRVNTISFSKRGIAFPRWPTKKPRFQRILPPYFAHIALNSRRRWPHEKCPHICSVVVSIG